MRQSKTRKNIFKPRYNLFLKTKSNLWANRFKIKKLIKKRKWGSVFFNFKNSRKIKSTQYYNLRKISNTLLKQNAFLIFNKKKNLLFEINNTPKFQFFKKKNLLIKKKWIQQLFNQLIQNFPLLLQIQNKNNAKNSLFSKKLNQNLNNLLINLNSFKDLKLIKKSIKKINYFFNFFQNSINFFKIKNDFLKFHNFKKFFILKRTHQLKFFGNYRDYIENETIHSIFFNKPFFRNNKINNNFNLKKNSNILIKHKTIKLTRLKVIKNFYSINSNKKLKKMLKQSLVKGKRYSLQSLFSQKLLLKLDTLCYEMNWSRSVLDSKNPLKRKEIFVNNTLQTSKRLFLKPGDLLKIQKPSKTKLFHQMFKKKNSFNKKNFYKKKNINTEVPSITLWFKFLRKLKKQKTFDNFSVSNDNIFKKINKKTFNKIEKVWPFLFLNKSIEQIIFNRMFFNANLKLGRHLKKQLFYPYKLLQKRYSETMAINQGFSQIKNQYYKNVKTPLGLFFGKRALFTYKTKLYNSKITVLNKKFLNLIKIQGNLNKTFNEKKFEKISNLSPRKIPVTFKMLYGFKSKRLLPKSQTRYLTVLLPFKTPYSQLKLFKSIFFNFNNKQHVINKKKNKKNCTKLLNLQKSLINFNNKQLFWLYYKNIKKKKIQNNYTVLNLTNKHFIQNFDKLELSFLSNNFSRFYLYNINNNANLLNIIKKKINYKFLNNKNWLKNIEKIILKDKNLLEKRQHFNLKMKISQKVNETFSYYDRILENIGKAQKEEDSYVSLEERRKLEQKDLFENQSLSEFSTLSEKQNKFIVLQKFLFKTNSFYFKDLLKISSIKKKNKKKNFFVFKWLNKRQSHYLHQKKFIKKQKKFSKTPTQNNKMIFNLNDFKLITNTLSKKLIFNAINRKIFDFKTKFLNDISVGFLKKIEKKTNWLKFLNFSYKLFFENDIQTNFLYSLKNSKTSALFSFLETYFQNNSLAYKDYFFKFEKLYLSLKQSPVYLECRKTKSIIICLPEPSKDFTHRQSLYLDQNNLFRLFK